MKVVAFMGSPRAGGNTSQLLQLVTDELQKEHIEVETISIGGQVVRGCTACMQCAKNQDQRCVIDADPMNEWIQKMIEADGILIASPTYFSNVSSEVKALLDRAGLVGKVNGDLFARKIAAAVIAVRRGGAVPAQDAINHMFLMSKMIVPGSIYWNFGIGLKPGDVQQDDEGLRTMRELGQTMAWLLSKTAE